MPTTYDNRAHRQTPAPARPRAAGVAASTRGRSCDIRLAVQRSLGNNYIQRAAEHGESSRELGESVGCRGGCGGCGLRRPVQTKLTVGPAGDAYEQEADRVAEQVVGISDAAYNGGAVHDGPLQDIQRQPAVPCERAGAPNAALPTSGGRPLSAATRAFMEPRFGQDFSEVQLHSDPDAHRLATQIRARAFTHHHHVFIRHGESEHDHRLMAHELTHVVQQPTGGSATPGLTRLATSATRPSRTDSAMTRVQRAISPELEQIEDYLSYGFFDWAITDKEAARALELLKALSRFQQAAFFANAEHAGRLRDNLPEGRRPELDALATDVADIHPPAATVAEIQDRLSYGLFDWVITDQDAVEALEKLKQLSSLQLATTLAAVNYSRLMDNLPDARKPELAELYDRGLGLGGTRQTAEEEHPGMLIKSITFRSDHGMMKDNADEWTNSGQLFGEPEWFVSNGKVVSHPISQNRNTDVRVELGLNVLPANARSAPIRLTGRSSEAALNFEFSGSMKGGFNQSVLLTSAAKLPDTITALENRQVVWDLQWRDWKHEVGRTSHTIFVTTAAPLAPGEVTLKRMRTATELIGEAATRIGSVDPHSLVREVMKRPGLYNLDVVLGYAPGDEWKLADNLDVGAQCIDIVRFVDALLRTVGCPGTSTAVVVWANPFSPHIPIRSTWPNGGLGDFPVHPAHPNWHAALMDANGCPNNYEAALEFGEGGILRYYPGGVPMDREYKTPLDVLHVFQCLVWLTALAPKMFEIQQIPATYPGGTCLTGEVRCH